MRIIRTADLKPGFVVGRALTDEKGNILLQQGVELTQRYIQALETKGYNRLYVQDPDLGDDDIEPPEDLSPATRAKAMLTLQRSFAEVAKQLGTVKRQSFDELLEACSSETARVLMGSKGPLADMHEVANSILNEALTHSTLAGLTSMKSADSHLYDHSIDVCVTGIMIGRTVGLTNTRLRQLATGCLLHDIGMMFIDDKVSRTTKIHHHTRLGYELLKNNDDPDIMAPHVALEHHERQDGSGLPRGLIGSNTIARDRSLRPPIPTLIGEIAAVADIYDILLTGAANQDPMPPDMALNAIRQAAGTHLNRQVVEAFLRVVPVYPQGMEIIVRSEYLHNYSGIVTKVNPTQLDRPVITLVRNNHGKAIPAIAIDLVDKTDMFIRCKGL